jgi:hypothetical protein
LRVVGIRPDGTIIVCERELRIEEILRSALGYSADAPIDYSWDSVLNLDELQVPRNAQLPIHAPGKTQITMVGKAWKIHLDNWKDWVRQRPLGILEKNALKELVTIKGLTPRRIKGAGPDTMDRLEARGFVTQVEGTKAGRFPMYAITPAGESAWRRISDVMI